MSKEGVSKAQLGTSDSDVCTWTWNLHAANMCQVFKALPQHHAAFAAMRIGEGLVQTSGYQNVSITLFQLQKAWQPHAHDAWNAETS